MPRYAAKRDDNEQEIVDTLKDLGVEVHRLNEENIPDLLVGFRGTWYTLEVKGEGKPLRPGQQEFFNNVEAPAFVVRTSERALQAIGAMGRED